MKSISLNSSALIPLSLYIHMPWCERKCPYCDFNSHPLRGNLPEKAYIQALINEAWHYQTQVQTRTIQSIFIGGGTPSLISAAGYQQLFQALHEIFMLAPDCEITLEANPGSVEQTRFCDYYQVGINRISLGVQSFQDDKLKSLGRIHCAHEAKQAAGIAQQAGFDNINIDLMHGLAQQSVADALFDLTCAFELNPTHISWYQLTLEPNTYFYQYPPKLPEDDILWEIQQAGGHALSAQNYQQYEISAYAKPHRQCHHNLNYWQYGDYLGLGAGAHGKITDQISKQVIRYQNPKHPKIYLGTPANQLAKITAISQKDLIFEFMLNATRLYQPILFDLFENRTQLNKEKIQDLLDHAQQQGFIKQHSHGFSTTSLGKRFLNELQQLFLL